MGSDGGEGGAVKKKNRAKPRTKKKTKTHREELIQYVLWEFRLKVKPRKQVILYD
jgi:hypothetical protein